MSYVFAYGVSSSLEMFLYALLLYCIMAPKATPRMSAVDLQLKYGVMLSQSPYAECTSAHYLHQALSRRNPPISIGVTWVAFLWNLV